MLKRTFVAWSVAALSLTGIAFAQESATITLRSGERLSAQLVDCLLYTSDAADE